VTVSALSHLQLKWEGVIETKKVGRSTREHFYPALRTAEAKQIRFHDLRHTSASILIKQGENLKYIQSQLGHANPSVTLNTYSHLLETVNQESACRGLKAPF
jgi:integrase